MWTRAFLAGLCLYAHTAWAQDASPLSVIDWLNEQPDEIVPQVNEPDVTQSGDIPTITTRPLLEDGTRRIGLAAAELAGLPADLWSQSDGRTLAQQIQRMPSLHLPAAQGLLFKAILLEADPAKGSSDVVDLARVDALTARGALDPALTLLKQIGPDRTPAHFARFADLSLLNGTEAEACAMLIDMPHLSPGEAMRIFCIARTDDWETAALILGTSAAVETLTEQDADALARFLDPDLFEGSPPLSLPDNVDPLRFKVFAAIGQPIPTRTLPVIFANADLSPDAGWKGQLEAAERLGQQGALPENRLIGIYSNRRPAASGGVWDRVQAVQRLEAAIATGSDDAVNKTLPVMWKMVKENRLALPMARLFAEQLDPTRMTPAARRAATEMQLLSGVATETQDPILLAIATDASEWPTNVSAKERAVMRGLRDAIPDGKSASLIQRGETGAALLRSIEQLHTGAGGDVSALTSALATLRALDQKVAARQAALEILILGSAS
ncbi:MAG: hypothetical protein ACFB11_17795 [Paracoccaceae bacterium]